MANPNPQHTPTDGLGVAAYVVLADTGRESAGSSALTNLSGGTLPHPGSQGTHVVGSETLPLNGQGIGATEGKSGVVSTAPGFPVAQYACTLSLSAAGGYLATAIWLATAKDVQNNTYAAPVSNFMARSYNDPAAGSPAWYRPSNFAGYDASVASVVASSTNDHTITVTALAVGQATIEVAFPTFDLVSGEEAESGSPDFTDFDNQFAEDMIYVQVLVTVIP